MNILRTYPKLASIAFSEAFKCVERGAIFEGFWPGDAKVVCALGFEFG